MNALPNANKDHQRTGLTSFALPKAVSSKTGVSVEYVYSPDKYWYVFRATRDRQQRANDAIVESGSYVYLARGWKLKVVDGKKRKVKMPLFNLIFVYVTSQQADAYIHNTAGLEFLTYYYDHFTVTGGKNPPLVVPEREMMNFIRVTALDNEHVMCVTPEECHFKSEDTVRVIDGPFEGVYGRVARVAGQQRVVIRFLKDSLIATAYIPSAFLVPEKEEQ